MTERVDRHGDDTAAPDGATAARDAAPSKSAGPARAAAPRTGVMVGESDDRLEREADAVARQVVSVLRRDASGSTPSGGGNDPRVRRGAAVPSRSPSGGADRIRRSATIGEDGGELDHDTADLLRGSRSGGAQLPAGARSAMESAFGEDFGDVRVHTGAAATELNDRIQAKAFTTGSDIYFRDGLPDAGTSGGQELLAHELTHVVQQGGGLQRATDGEQIQRKKGGRKKKAKRNRKKNQQRNRGRGGRARPTVQAPPATVPTADSAFARLASLVDAAVPATGDSAGLEASVTIPLGTPTTFLEFDLEGELGRDDDGVEGSFDVAIGYGGTIEPFGLTPEIVGKLGGTVEAKASTAAEMLKLISYGFFRQFRETNLVPKELTNLLWGQGGETGKSAGEEADQWGAEIENEIFADQPDAEVGIGAYGSVGASLGDEDAFKGELSTKVSSTTTYNKDTLESSGSGGASQLGKSGKERDGSGVSGYVGYYLNRGREKSVGEVARQIETELTLSSGGLEGQATFAVAIQSSLEFELEVSAKGELSASERKPVQIAETIATLLANLRGLVNFVRANERSFAQYASHLGETVDNIGSFVDAFSTKKDELVEELNGKIGGKGARSVELGWSIEYEGGSLKQPELALSYLSEYKAEGLGVEAKVERKRQLVAAKWPKL